MTETSTQQPDRGRPSKLSGGFYVSMPVLIAVLSLFIALIAMLINAHLDLWKTTQKPLSGEKPDVWSENDRAEYDRIRKQIDDDFKRMNADLLELKRENDRLQDALADSFKRSNQAQLDMNQSQYDSLLDEARQMLEENIKLRQELEAGHPDVPDADTPADSPVNSPSAVPPPTR